MKDRWWSPSGPHIGPDTADLALLSPGGEARYDLGAALFALHRTGAAACEVVAASPIPDKYSLIESLATARLGVAEPMVECVAKCVEGETYAGLLVRDLADEAEEGALHVFTTVVSKGVPASLAAQRAGLVYGVPKDSLGKFLPLACDLRAHPAALTDAADRVLFGYVEKICTQEVVDTKQEVSKATAVLERPATETFVEQDHPRDVEGRFSTKRTGTLSERLGLKQTTTQPATKTKSKVRSRRTVRARRESAQARTEQQLKAVISGTGIRHQVRGRPISSMLRKALDKTDGTKAGPNMEFPPDLMKPIDTGGEHFGEIDGSVSIVMPASGWSAMAGVMAGQGSGYDPFTFRMGYLTEALRHAGLPDPGLNTDPVAQNDDYGFVDAGTPDEQENLRRVAALQRADLKPAPEAVELDSDELENADWDDHHNQSGAVWHAASDLAKHYLDNVKHMSPDDPDFRREREAIAESMMHNIMTGTKPDSMALIHVHEDVDLSRVIRFKLPFQGVRGKIISGGEDDLRTGLAGTTELRRPGRSGHEDVVLDPNQAFKIVPVPTLQYDVHASTVVETYDVVPLGATDPLWDRGNRGNPDHPKVIAAKADTMVLERPAVHTFDAEEHPRDAEGRFATGTSLSARLGTATPQRTGRSVRARRRRRERQTRPEIQSVSHPQIQSNIAVKPLTPVIRSQIQRVFQKTPTKFGVPGFEDLSQENVQQVITEQKFDDLLRLLGRPDSMMPGSSIYFDSNDHDDIDDILFEHEPVNADKAVKLLHQYTVTDAESQINSGKYAAHDLFPSMNIVYDPDNALSATRFHRNVIQALKGSVHGQHIEVNQLTPLGTRADGNKHKAEMHVTVNKHVLPANVLVIQEHLDPDKPLEMVFDSHRQLPVQDSTDFAKVGNDPDQPSAALVLTSPKVQVVRLRNGVPPSKF